MTAWIESIHNSLADWMSVSGKIIDGPSLSVLADYLLARGSPLGSVIREASLWSKQVEIDKFGLRAFLVTESLQIPFRWIDPPTSNRLSALPNAEIRGFWIAETPTTQRQWEVHAGYNKSRFRGASRPVERVTCQEAQDWAKALDAAYQTYDFEFRLPLRVEWETATLGGLHLEGTFGDKLSALSHLAWTREDNDRTANDGSAIVGLKQPNGFGLYDMLGNVGEWVLDSDVSEFGDQSTSNFATVTYYRSMSLGWDASRRETERVFLQRHWEDEASDRIGFRLVRGVAV